MDCYRITVPSYHVELCKKLHQLQQSQYLCDTVVQCDDGVLYVHKLVLLSCGSQHFNSNLHEEQSSTVGDDILYSISLDKYSCQVVKIMIQGVYTGEMFIIQNLRNEIISLCEFLGLKNFVLSIRKMETNEENTTDEGKSMTGSNYIEIDMDMKSFQIEEDCREKARNNENKDNSTDDPIQLLSILDIEKQNKQIPESGVKNKMVQSPKMDKRSENLYVIQASLHRGNEDQPSSKRLPRSILKHKSETDEVNVRQKKIIKQESDADNTHQVSDKKQETLNHKSNTHQVSDKKHHKSKSNYSNLKSHGRKKTVKCKNDQEQTDFVSKLKCKDYDVSNSDTTVDEPILINRIAQNSNVRCASTSSFQNDTQSDEAYSCNLCQYVTICKGEMNDHMVEIHGEKSGHTEKWKPNESVTHNTKERFACQTCPYRTNLKNNLRRHERSHAKSELVKAGLDTSEFEQTYLCHTCGKKLKSTYALTLHVRTHTGLQKYQCSQCDCRFNLLRSLRTHLKTHDTTPQQQCPVCKRLFKEEEIPEHGCSPAVFEKDGVFTCVECGHISKNKQCLLEHQQGKHKQKRYSCPNCGKLFSWRSSKIAHMKRCVSTVSVVVNSLEDQ